MVEDLLEELECHQCGATGGSFELTPAGWSCLAHRPRIGQDRRRYRSMSDYRGMDPGLFC